MVKRDRNLEYKVLQIIKKSGTEGILQSNLWKKMNASSREGSRVSLRLEKAGLIDRKMELNQGKWTYKLIAKKRAIKSEIVLDFPCVFCIDQERCGTGSFISPPTCERLTVWIHHRAFSSNNPEVKR
ncbi:MAG: transcriptional regulator [Candidatus Bathyarchaeota archaeon]